MKEKRERETLIYIYTRHKSKLKFFFILIHLSLSLRQIQNAKKYIIYFSPRILTLCFVTKARESKKSMIINKMRNMQIMQLR